MKTYSIGRNPECDICYDDPRVSRLHAMLRVYHNGKMEIISSGQNGTKVNGRPITAEVPYKVSRKDTVTFAEARTLDWNQIHNPLKHLKLVLWILAGLLALSLLGLGVSKCSCSSPQKDKEKIEQKVDAGKKPSAKNDSTANQQPKKEVEKETNKDRANIVPPVDAPSAQRGSNRKGHDRVVDGDTIPSESQFFPPQRPKAPVTTPRKEVTPKGGGQQGGDKGTKKPEEKPTQKKKKIIY